MTHANLTDIITPSSYGCWIDNSHEKADELSANIIFFAARFGYDVDVEQVQNDLVHYDDYDLDVQADISQGLWEESALALDWLNDETSKIDARYSWYIDDNSLYLEYEDEEGTEFNQ